MILNNGQGGTSVAHTLYTTSTLLSLGQGTGTGVNEATFLVGDTLGTVPGETIVLLYDNVAGTGRPTWGTWTESDGIDATAFTLWNTYVTCGRWGAYVPNDLANGIRRIEYWDIGSNTLLGYLTSETGVWPTINQTPFLAANGDTTFNGGVTSPIGIVVPVPEPTAFGLIALGSLVWLASPAALTFTRKNCRRLRLPVHQP